MLDALDGLGESVRAIDAVADGYTWGRGPLKPTPFPQARRAALSTARTGVRVIAVEGLCQARKATAG